MPIPISRCGGNPCGGLIDSTATAGDTCGVHSVGAAAGRVLTANGAGGSAWSAAGGYTPPIAHETINASIFGGVLPFTFGYVDGSALVDFTNPTAPEIIAAGVYAFTGALTAWPVLGATSYATARVIMTQSTVSIPISSTVQKLGGLEQVVSTMGGVSYFPAHWSFSGTLDTNLVAGDFTAEIFIQRIS